MGNSNLRQQREFPGGCRCIAPAAVRLRKPGPSGRTKKPAWLGKAPRRLSLLRSSSLKRWNRRRDETSLYNRWTTQSGEFRTLYDQVRMVGIRNLSFSKILQLPFDADSFRISISVLWFYALFKFKKIIVNFIEYLKLTMII